jgi:hypothetical protein
VVRIEMRSKIFFLTSLKLPITAGDAIYNRCCKPCVNDGKQNQYLFNLCSRDISQNSEQYLNTAIARLSMYIHW